MERIFAIFGLLFFLGIPYLLSTNRKAVSFKLVAWGLGLQIFFAIIILPNSFFNVFIKSVFELQQAPGAMFFSYINDGIVSLLGYTKKGSDFLFSSFTMGKIDPALDNFVFSVLPTILFFSGLMAVLYHLGIIQVAVKGIAKAMKKTMGTSGSESLSASANIFVGQTEAPLVIKPYIEKMTKSELLAVMTGGMATVSGGVMAAYVAFLKDYFPDIAGHLMAASIMSAPAALVIAKILVPETEKSQTAGDSEMDIPKTSSNVIDAAAGGASDGLKLAANVAAMLMVFIALIALLNSLLISTGNLFGLENMSFERLTGYLFSPLAFLMGVEWQDITKMASILGQKTIINEFVAFKSLGDLVAIPISPENPGISNRSIMIITYALAGFSNFSSIAIQIGGIGSIAPSRRKELASLGLRALLAGTFACLMTAALAGIISTGEGGSTLKVQQAGSIASANQSIKTIKEDFTSLKNRIDGKESLGFRTAFWRGNVKGSMVNWDGTFYKKMNDGVLFYYGVKYIENVVGTENHKFLFYKFPENKLATYKFKVWRNKKGTVKKEVFELTASELRPGDTVKNIHGILDRMAVNNRVFFIVVHKDPLKVKKKK